MTFITSLRRWDRESLYHHLPTVLLIVLFLIFTIVTVYIARNLDYGIIPDEGAHIAFSKAFARTWAIPAETPDIYEYGVIRYRPYLFYWINGRVINFLSLLIPSPTQTIIVLTLRMINVFYSLVSLWFVYMLTKEVIKNRWWQLLVIFLLTNTLMYVFLAGGVSYDNLSNLLSIASIYFLLRMANGNSFYPNTLGMFISITLGALVKITNLPVAVITGMIWLIYTVKNRKCIDFKPVFDRKTIVLLAVTIVFIALNLWLYGYNLITFQRVLPGCEQFLPNSVCRMTAIFERDVTRRPPQPITSEEILDGRSPFFSKWLSDYWIHRMSSTIFGIYGHKIYNPGFLINFYELLIVWVIFLTVRYWKKPSISIAILIAVFAFYTLTLLYTHYSNELVSRFQHYGIQGRYIFPVMGVIYILMVYFMSNVSNTVLRKATVAYTLVLFMFGGTLLTMIPSKNLKFPPSAIAATRLVGEIVSGFEVYQTFVSECKGTITEIDLFMDSYGRTNTHPVVFQLLDRDTNKLVAEQTIPAGVVREYAWQSFPVPPMTNTTGKNYQIILLSPESVPGDAVSVYISRSNNYLNGQALVNSIPEKGDLRFRYICVQPVLANWFHE